MLRRQAQQGAQVPQYPFHHILTSFLISATAAKQNRERLIAVHSELQNDQF
jgi:hypothetical protein